MNTKYSVRLDELIITRLHNGAYEIVTWASGHRFVQVYYGYTKRDAIREFRHTFTTEFPNP